MSRRPKRRVTGWGARDRPPPARDHYFPNHARPGSRDRYRAFAALVQPTETVAAMTNDDPDNRILECALAAQAERIVSGDHHLQQLKTFRIIPSRAPWSSWTARRGCPPRRTSPHEQRALSPPVYNCDTSPPLPLPTR